MPRARITIVDLVFIPVNLAILSALWPVVHDAILANAGELTTGEALIYRALLPLLLLILMTGLSRKATEGVV